MAPGTCRRAAMFASLLFAGVATSVLVVWVPLVRQDWQRSGGQGWNATISGTFRATSPTGRLLRVSHTRTWLMDEWLIDPAMEPLPPIPNSGIPHVPDDTPALAPVTPPSWAPWPADIDGKGVGATRWGWPLRCLSAQFDRTKRPMRSGYSIRSVPVHVWTIRLNQNPVRIIQLPTKVVWAGLIMNTALFASMFAAIVLGPRMLLRTLRRRRKSCPACGYDTATLGPATPCPECGAA